MAYPLTSKKRAAAISRAGFFIGLALVSFTKAWWPYTILVLGSSLALRHYLLGRWYDMGVTLLVFGGVFVTIQYEVSWDIFLPIVFTLAAIYILFREWTMGRGDEVEQEEDLNHEFEEDKK